MVIDAANGVEAQTKRLIEVCRQRDTPIMTFVNKMDREGRDPIELLDEIEAELGMPCVPMTWPVGQGKAFGGIINLRTQTMRVFQPGEDTVEASAAEEIPLSDTATLKARFGPTSSTRWRTSSCSPACRPCSTARPFSPPGKRQCSSVLR